MYAHTHACVHMCACTHTHKLGMISTLEVDADDHKFTVALTQPGLCETLSQKSGTGSRSLGDDSVLAAQYEGVSSDLTHNN